MPAEGHLSEALAAVNDSWIAGNQSTPQGSLSAVRSHLGRVRISGSPVGARVRVGDTDRG